jgi:hypothetical protein
MSVYDRIEEAVKERKINTLSERQKNINFLKNQMYIFIIDNINDILNLIKTSSSPSIHMPTDISYDEFNNILQDDKRELGEIFKDFNIFLCAIDKKMYIHIIIN